MFTVKNIAGGPRGFYDKNTPVTAGPIMLEKGGVATDVEFTDGELEAAKATGYFEITKTGKAQKGDKPGAKVTAPETKAPADMTDDELRAELKAKLGDLAPGDADRAAMLGLLAG